MSLELTWFGHACWQLRSDATTLLIDPFLNDNPVAPVKADAVHPNYVLISHGHFDHIADAASIANRTNATVLSNYEITTWLSAKHGVKNTVGMNLGGGVNLPFGRVQLTVAHHSSQLPDGSYGGNPSGFLVTIDKRRVYFACDTALFGDMKLIGDTGIDLAVMPIGDLFTMGPDDSLEAIRLVAPKVAVPSHYNTWPPIGQDADAWAERVRKETCAKPVIAKVGVAIHF